MSTTKQPRTERWIAARHVDRVLGLLVQPAYSPDMPLEQYEAAVGHAVKGLAAITKPHANGTHKGGWQEALEEATTADDYLEVFAAVYLTMWGSGLLRPSPLEEEEV